MTFVKDVFTLTPFECKREINILRDVAYYRILHDIENYSGAEWSAPPTSELVDPHWAKPIGKRRHRLPDLSSYSSSVLLAKISVAKIMEKEFSDLKFSGITKVLDEEYTRAVAPELPDLININQSDVEFFPEDNVWGLPTTQIQSAKSISFLRDVGLPIFCPSELYDTGIFCNEDFKSFVEVSGLTGLEFVPIDRHGIS